MEKNIKNVYICILSHSAVQLRLAQHGKSTILQKKLQKTKTNQKKQRIIWPKMALGAKIESF